MKIKFTNFSREFLDLKKAFSKKLHDIGSRGQYVLGEELKIFEKNIQKFLNVKHALGVGNWTEGTVMVFKALNYNYDDEIITVSNSFIATCGAIVYSGLKPKLVDVGNDMNIDTRLLKKIISKKTKAIMPVHLSGIPSDLKTLKEICQKNKLHLIEDAAHAFGAKYKDKFIGTIGDVGLFSLHPRKNFHVLGDGGLIVTNNSKLYKKLLLIRNHGLKSRDKALMWGTNSRLDNLQAGFGNIMLNKIDVWNKTHLNIAKVYSYHLKKYLVIPKFDSKISKPTFHQYIVRTKYRNELRKFLKQNNIETAIHYPIPIHRQEAFKKNFGKVQLPNTEKYAKEILSLPISPYLTNKETKYIVKKIKEFFENKH